MKQQNLSDVELRRYYDQQIRAWFGEVRPLRLEGSGRFFTPPPALPLRAVFVAPALSPSYLQPTDAEPDMAGGNDIVSWFETQRRIVVLGDPGSGKSTLVGWLAWRLCAGLTEPLPAWTEGVLPIPMILRDMQLNEVEGFNDLLAAFCKTDLIAGHDLLREAWGAELQRQLEANSASLLFLIDGLDELSLAVRDKVRAAIRQGMALWPQARFMVTSRIVGYEQSAIESTLPTADDDDRHLSAASFARLGVRMPQDVHRLYVMPFDAARIRRFAHNWFEHGETDDRRGGAYLQKFIDGVMRDPVALQLARTPNLLVMAAQVFGITNTLPDGRAKLYEAITKAYLESIDQRYGLVDQRYSFEQKRSWLAAVGYHMQARRSEAANEAGRDLLVGEREVVAWLGKAMQDSGLEADADYVHAFVDAIARRSGLFIPRGEGLYAFAHLSIQEFFAALHLQSEVRDFAVSDPSRLESLLEELGRLAEQAPWREALITFFELPDWSPRVIARLCKAVFGADLERVPDTAQREHEYKAPTNATLVELLVRLAVNPGVALPESLRQRGIERAMAYLRSEREGKFWSPYSGVMGAMTVNEEGSRRMWALLGDQPAALSGSVQVLDLRGARSVDYTPLLGFIAVEQLLLEDSSISDLSPLANMSRLTHLILNRSPVESLRPLAGLGRIESLDLSGTRVSDLSPLSNLAGLRTLALRFTEVSDLAALARLASLESLMLTGTRVADISALSELTSLRSLSLNETLVNDISPLSQLPQLEHLDLMLVPVSDFSVLRSLRQLTHLDLDQTAIADLSVIGGLENLRTLYLNSTNVSDLAPLAGLSKLTTLMLGLTRVSDVRPLASLHELTSLWLVGTAVTDTSSLAGLSNLTIKGGPNATTEAA